MTRFPIFLDLKGRKAVVIGGGAIAFRKLKGLLEAGTQLTVISPELSDPMRELLMTHSIRWVKRNYQEGDEADAMIVIAATNDAAVNRAIATHTKEWQLTNVVDQPHLGNFHIPSQVKRGKLTLAVSTEGASPLLAKDIRNELAERYQDEYEGYLEFLSQSREKVKKENISEREKRVLLKTVLDPQYKDPLTQQKLLGDFSTFVNNVLTQEHSE